MIWDSIYNVVAVSIYVFNQVLAIVLSILLILKKYNPVKTFTWVLVMLLLPYIGLIMYLFFGRNFRKEKIFNRKGAADNRVKKILAEDMLNTLARNNNILPKKLDPFSRLVFQNLKASSSVITKTDDYKIYFTGKDALNAMLEAIDTAKEHIHLQSYIIEDDQIGRKFKDLLIAKSKQGLKVRLMFDGLGSKSLPKRFKEELLAAKVEVLNFSPFRWFCPPLIVNYRNHRKILIVDGYVGFLGGVNIADRYLNGGEFKEWRDTHMMLKGSSVFSLQASFLLDRYFIINKNIKSRKKYYPSVDTYKTVDNESTPKLYTQILTSGPDSDWASIMQCYFTAITQAKKHVYIVTPYFVPNESILSAVKIAALSNINVSIMLPERSDTWLAHWGSMSYITELLDAGVSIYLFKKGFNHSKVMSVDKEFSIIGSANLDNRSMEHNFEVMAVMYDGGVAKIVEDRFERDISRCTLITKTKWSRRPIRNRIYESIARLVSPML